MRHQQCAQGINCYVFGIIDHLNPHFSEVDVRFWVRDLLNFYHGNFYSFQQLFRFGLLLWGWVFRIFRMGFISCKFFTAFLNGVSHIFHLHEIYSVILKIKFQFYVPDIALDIAK